MIDKTRLNFKLERNKIFKRLRYRANLNKVAMCIKKLCTIPNWRNDKRDEQAASKNLIIKFNYYSSKLTLYKYNIITIYNRKQLIIGKISAIKCKYMMEQKEIVIILEAYVHESIDGGVLANIPLK